MSLHRTFVLRNDTYTQALIAFITANAAAMASAGTPLSVTVSQHKAKRSIEQNSMLHAILSEIAEGAWVNGRQFPMEVWKEFFRAKFIGTEEMVMPDGQIKEKGLSTTTLDVAAFSDFINQISEYAATVLGLELML